MKNIFIHTFIACGGLLSSLFLYSADVLTNTSTKLPVVYSNEYNIHLFGIEKYFIPDGQKSSLIANYLSKKFKRTVNELFYKPEKPADDTILKKFHTEEYLKKLKSGQFIVDRIGKTPINPMLNWIVQSRIIKPLRFIVAGTIEASNIAFKTKSCAINLGGGFHMADNNRGDLGDIQLAMLNIWEKKNNAKILYIDLDAYQGVGIEFSLKEYMQETDPSKPRLIVFDLYYEKGLLFEEAKEIRTDIQYNNPVVEGIEDTAYLDIVKTLENIIKKEEPDCIFYNAGANIYESDMHRIMKISADGIKQRDELVFSYAKENNVPIVMTLSSGILGIRQNDYAQLVGESITNVLEKVYSIKPLQTPAKKSFWFIVTSLFNKK